MIVGPGAPAPEHWAGADRVVIDDAALRDPRRARSTRCTGTGRSGIPVVVELQCSVDELRAPETEPARPPYALSPRFEFARERLYFLARANNYDDRVGRMAWGPDARGAAPRRDDRPTPPTSRSPTARPPGATAGPARAPPRCPTATS